MKVRRSKYVAYFLADGKMPNLAELLEGRISVSHQSMVIAASAIAEAESLLTHEEFLQIQQIPSRAWVDAADIAKPDRALVWSRSGLLISDLGDDWAKKHREREETLDCELWHCRSAVYHFMAKWRGVSLFPPVDVSETDPYGFAITKLAEGMASWGKLEPAPPPFWSHPNASRRVGLETPAPPKNSEFYRVLLDRASTRYFDPVASIPLTSLSSLLYYTFAPLGTAESVYTAIHKTSPSGGGLHPTEAYLLARNVDGLEPGLYHYHAHDHSLEMLSSLSQAEATRRSVFYAAGQPYTLHAGALIILASRFYRNHWKYRHNERTYTVMAMDIGHLGQTLYLLSTKLGLGGFFTAAVNSADIEADLGLDGAQQGVMAAFAVGVKHRESASEFSQFLHREAPT